MVFKIVYEKAFQKVVHIKGLLDGLKKVFRLGVGAVSFLKDELRVNLERVTSEQS